MSKLTERAEKYFKSPVSRSKVHATVDGFMFTQVDHAKAHAKTLEDKTVHTFTKPSEGEEVKSDLDTSTSDFMKLSVSDMGKALEDITDIPTLQGYLDKEANSENPRSTAIAAIEKRMEELAKDLEVKK